MSSCPPLLQVNNLTKAFGSKNVVSDISLTLKKGEIGCLLGPSGCGKTTLLRTIAGFESHTEGTISLLGKTVSSPDMSLPPEKRKIGMVFQDYALFPHLTVSENIGFGLNSSGRKEKADRVGNLLDIIGLTHCGKNYPHELSGGQQQRVALARALAPSPQLLLLDEPFSNLDVTLREKLTIEVREIIKAAGITALMVTHNQFEAFSVADVVGVIFDGTLRQWDSPYNIYHKPTSIEVATFVGDGTIVDGKVTGPGEVNCGLGPLKGSFSLPCDNGCDVQLLIRPEDILHVDDAPIKAEILHKSFRGPNILYKLKIPTGEPCLALVSSHHNHQLGEYIGIVPEVDNIVIFQ